MSGSVTDLASSHRQSLINVRFKCRKYRPRLPFRRHNHCYNDCKTQKVVGNEPEPKACFVMGDTMKTANVSNYAEQACILSEKSAASTAHSRAGNDCLIIKIPPPEVIAHWDTNDDPCELKRILRDLRWTGMISDALVVLAITGAIYFSPSLETMRAIVERAAISVAEASRAR